MFICPNCGEPIQNDNAQACPHCGSDRETGWNPDADYLSVEIPEESEEDPYVDNTGIHLTTPFSIFLIILILLGILAFFGPYALLNPFLFLGILSMVAAFIFYSRKHKKNR